MRFHEVDNPEILAFSKRDPVTGDTVLVVCTTNPHAWREATVHVDLDALGFADGGWDSTYTVRDQLTGAEYRWGEDNYVRLDPHAAAAHIFVVTR